MKPTLVVLAAGMGSRYGGLKQLDGVGPHGETIMDYSVYDAVSAGFGKVVFVIRCDFEEAFRKQVLSKYKEMIPVEVVFQSMDDLPEGYTCPATRLKPWGTNHATMMAKGVIDTPFAVINADDYYGKESYQLLADELTRIAGTRGQYCMVGFPIANTLSDSGTVSRGVCGVDHQGYLTTVVERTDIARDSSGRIVFIDETGHATEIAPDTLVSMNMWGFTPDYFDHSERAFINFLDQNLDHPKREFYIPTVVNDLIQEGKATVKVLDTPSHWFGVTYPEDRPAVVEALKQRGPLV